ncbi:DUF3298 and DUF4163 domain-containing protein [Vulcaniibacterium tengchongense]|uniref:Uncharacterized protein DUF3298 n=1 Tax=Vulcaniibacterium tengchongense TaxID=1273429 RepID=A0A3N4VKA9_9GAMM|nr:DUF3298 and DUF4163 domain-containing protein [Vulcaniibacterium tengchongense]RPE81875.1 uncharacterized protein DUF3298 [Vulcaniibacterium tengchongense]
MRRTEGRALLMALTVALALGACKREAPAPAAPASAPQAPAAPGAQATRLELKDVIESTPDYIVGISYQVPAAASHPGLAAELKRYADAARAELLDAARGRSAPGGASSAPYDLSLSFTQLLDTPNLVAVAADGSRYTGGAHGEPLIARFVWLVPQQRLLRAEDLLAGAAGWQAISRYVREQLHAALSQRVDADELAPAERADLVKNVGRMIDDGTEPQPQNFDLFEPMAGQDGRLAGLRFVFPPYQVGPYSDGTQTVEVPAAVLLPHLAPEYKPLFAGG